MTLDMHAPGLATIADTARCTLCHDNEKAWAQHTAGIVVLVCAPLYATCCRSHASVGSLTHAQVTAALCARGTWAVAIPAPTPAPPTAVLGDLVLERVADVLHLVAAAHMGARPGALGHGAAAAAADEAAAKAACASRGPSWGGSGAADCAAASRARSHYALTNRGAFLYHQA
jgi:hypothetical protein